MLEIAGVLYINIIVIYGFDLGIANVWINSHEVS